MNQKSIRGWILVDISKINNKDSAKFLRTENKILLLTFYRFCCPVVNI